jgi:HlyD family secretion protein
MRYCSLGFVALSLVVPRGFAAEDIVRATGTLEPSEVVDVCAEASGVLQSLGASDYGAVVKKGDVLGRLNPAQAEVGVTQSKADLQRAQTGLTVARAKLDLTEKEYARLTRNADKQGDAADLDVAKARLNVAKAEVESAEAGIEQAKAGLQLAQLELERCTIRSPIDGRIIDRRVNVGQAVPGNLNAPSLFLIAKDLDKLQIWASVSEADISRVAVGQPVRFTVDALPGKSFTGKIAQLRLNAAMTRNVVTYTAVIDVSTSDEKLLPYMTAHVEIATAEKPKLPSVP